MFSSDQFKMVAIDLCTRESPMHSILSLRNVQSVEFETVPMLVWLMMALSHPFKEKHQVLLLISPPGDQWCKPPKKNNNNKKSTNKTTTKNKNKKKPPHCFWSPSGNYVLPDPKVFTPGQKKQTKTTTTKIQFSRQHKGHWQKKKKREGPIHLP